MAVADYNYCFTYIDVGCNVIVSDGVFRNCSLYTALENGLLLEGYHLVGDDAFQSHLIISIALFNELLKNITPYLTKKDTVMRDSLSVEERLALTLRFLATGRAFEDMKFSVTISPSAISQAIIETCEVLCSPGLHEGKSNMKMFYSNYFYCKVESKTYHECLWNIMKPSYRNNQMRLKCIITY